MGFPGLDNSPIRRVTLVNASGDPTYGSTSSATATSNGLLSTKLISAATTNATSVKASAGQVYYVTAFNNSSTIIYLKFYDKASAPTVGSDTPVRTLLIPHNNGSGAGFVIPYNTGVPFTSGIAFALTGGIADSDTAAVAANAAVVNISYI